MNVFLFADDLQAAIDNAQRIKAKSPTFEWHFHEATLNLLANPTLEAEEAHLRFAMPSPGYRCYAHYTVGMLALAKGDRDRVIEQFKLCVEMGRIDWWSHVWADAFLRRMTLDRKWPHWIEWKNQ